MILPMETIDGNTLIGDINGTVVGGATLVAGKHGNSLYTDGITQYVNYGVHDQDCFANPDMCANGITFSFWVMMLDQIPDFHTVFDSGSVYADSLGFSFKRESDGKPLARVATSTTTFFYRSDGIWELNQWLHVVFTWSVDDGIQLYFNGCPASGQVLSWLRMYQFAAYDPFVLGANGQLIYNAHMKLDHMLIWYEVLTPQEAWHLYVQGGTV